MVLSSEPVKPAIQTRSRTGPSRPASRRSGAGATDATKSQKITGPADAVAGTRTSHPAARDATVRTRSNHVMSGWMTRVRARISRTDAIAATLLANSRRDTDLNSSWSPVAGPQIGRAHV